jgi:antitoxin component YwqK of YwqJK toxin-antitoxin module
MAQDELRRLREENRLLQERLKKSTFISDSEGNLYDQNERLVRDSLGYLYSGGQVVGNYPFRIFHGERGTVELYPSGGVKEVTHNENSLWFRPGTVSYHPDGKTESTSYRHSEDDCGWTSFWRNGRVRCSDVTLGNTNISREFWENGCLKREEIREGGWARIKVFDEKGKFLFSTEHKI